MPELFYPSDPAPVLPRPSVDNPVPYDGTETEMLPVVEPNGVVIGQASRRYAHECRLLHPVVHLHVIDRMGRLYIQKRSMTKKLLPGYWDTAVGGHVSYGENVVEALCREASEELSFVGFNPVCLGSYVWESPTERELVHIFATVGNFSLSPDHDEVSDGRYWDMKDIEDNLGKSVFTPNFEQEFQRIRPSLEALL